MKMRAKNLHTSKPMHPRACTSLKVVGLHISSDATSSWDKYLTVPVCADLVVNPLATSLSTRAGPKSQILGVNESSIRMFPLIRNISV
jgi:hypothetical protein